MNFTDDAQRFLASPLVKYDDEIKARMEVEAGCPLANITDKHAVYDAATRDLMFGVRITCEQDEKEAVLGAMGIEQWKDLPDHLAGIPNLPPISAAWKKSRLLESYKKRIASIPGSAVVVSFLGLAKHATCCDFVAANDKAVAGREYARVAIEAIREGCFFLPKLSTK